MYVCLYIFVYITVCRDLNRVWQIKFLILITNAISTKVTDIDSLDKNINSFSYAKNE